MSQELKKLSEKNTVLQIYVAEKFTPDILSKQLKEIVDQYNGQFIHAGGCGSLGNFTGVYRATFSKSYCNRKDIANIIEKIQEIKSNIDGVKVTDVCQFNETRDCFVSYGVKND